MNSIAERRAAFRTLHQSGCFVLPNPWDGASAIRLAKLGFKALASTSAGAAWALGRSDGAMTVEEVLNHLRFLVGVTDLPVNADFEAGFADTPEGVATNVARCIETGVAGLSIEDREGRGLYPIDQAVTRIRAAREAINRSGQDVLLIGRCETFWMGQPDIEVTIARLLAYARAGADCLYAPGVKDLATLERLVRAFDKPLNANLSGTGLSVAELANVGVRRISVGGALAHATWSAFEGFAERLWALGRLPA